MRSSSAIRRAARAETDIGGAAAAVIALQQTNNDNTAADFLKWVAVLGFLVFNVSAVLQILSYGLLPALDQRAARRAAESES